MIECCLAQGCERERKGTERRTSLAVCVPLSPLGFAASPPITGAEALAYWCSSMLALGGVRHLSGVSL